jgi:cyclic pyranopterin monophosphate synthase
MTDDQPVIQTISRCASVTMITPPRWPWTAPRRSGADAGAGDRSRPRKVDRVELTHVDRAGAARMVDVSAKEPTARTAVATGVLRTTAEVVELLRRDGLPKGDALATARVAGIMGAKRTPDLVPLCHPIALSGVTVELEPAGAEVRIRATVRTTDRTGVEMEALTAVAVAGLTLHDMVKAVDPAATLDAVRVERKEGGKTGTWTRPEDGR